MESIINGNLSSLFMKGTDMLSFWLPDYMEYGCKAWFYRKKIDHNIFRSIFGTGYSIGIWLHVGAFKKDMQETPSLNWHSYQDK